MSKRIFFQNAAIMSGASLILRSLGIVFRIYVSNRIGAEGMGLYQMIVSVYVLMSSFASAGLNTAVTRLCTDALAENKAHEAKRLLYRCIIISIFVGVGTGVLLIGSALWVGECLLQDTRAVPSLKILTLSLPFMGTSSCIKGYFLAKRKVTSSSIAQILEQLVRIGSIVTILNMYHVQTVETACFSVMLGDTLAEIASCLYMTACYFFDKQKTEACSKATSSRGSLRKICHIAVPITSGRYLNSGLRAAENILVSDGLTAFIGMRDVALSLFGKLKGMAMPLLFFPSSFLNAFTALLIPEISEANTLRQTARLQYTVRRALQTTLQSSILLCGVCSAVATPLSRLVYNDTEIGTMLCILAPLAPIMYLESVAVGLLKGLDQQTYSLIVSIADSALRVILIPVLLPKYGMVGFYGVMILSNLMTCLLNLQRLCKVSRIRLCFSQWILKPVASVVLAVISCGVFPTMHNDLLDCILSGSWIILVYLTTMWLLGAITQNKGFTQLIKPT